MTDVVIELDELNRDVLYAPRVELFFSPNPGSSSEPMTRRPARRVF